MRLRTERQQVRFLPGALLNRFFITRETKRRGDEMRAAICTGYGPPEVLQIRTVPDPRPGSKEVCIRLVATSVTASDCIVRGLKLRGVYRLFMRAACGFRAPPYRIIVLIPATQPQSFPPQD